MWRGGEDPNAYSDRHRVVGRLRYGSGGITCIRVQELVGSASEMIRTMGLGTHFNAGALDICKTSINHKVNVFNANEAPLRCKC